MMEKPPIDSVEEFPERKKKADSKSSGNGVKDFVEDAMSKREDRHAVDAEIVRLAYLGLVDYEREREPAAEKLQVRVGILDELVKAARPHDEVPPGQGRPLLEQHASTMHKRKTLGI
jgi:hypothetical protein